MSVTPTDDTLIVALDFEGWFEFDYFQSYRNLTHRENCRC
jgi:hypothetical protein